MKIFALLPLYIVTILFAFGCVSGIFKAECSEKKVCMSAQQTITAKFKPVSVA